MTQNSWFLFFPPSVMMLPFVTSQCLLSSFFIFTALFSVRCWSIRAAAERRWSCASWWVCVYVSAAWRTWTGWVLACAGPAWRWPAHWRLSLCACCPSSLLRWPGTWAALPVWHNLYTRTLMRGNEGELNACMRAHLFKATFQMKNRTSDFWEKSIVRSSPLLPTLLSVGWKKPRWHLMSPRTFFFSETNTITLSISRYCCFLFPFNCSALKWFWQTRRHLIWFVCLSRFLTMDQTRKLLLILESDPKVYTLPLVGV